MRIVSRLEFENNPNYQYKLDTVNANLMYEGWGVTGIATSDAKWFIKRTSMVGTVESVTWALNGSGKAIWDSRTTYFTGDAWSNTLSTEFDGVNDLCTPTDTTVNRFLRTDTFSFSFWLRMKNLTGVQSITGNKNSTTAIGWGIYQPTTLTGALRFDLCNNNVLAIRVDTANSTLVLNTWQHYVVTYAGTSLASGVKIYRNGVSLGLTTVLDTLGTNSTASTAGFKIGGFATNSSLLNGYVDEYGMYNKELTGAEVTAIYNAGVPIDLTSLASNTNLVSYYRMGDGDTFPVIRDTKASATYNLNMINMLSTAFVSVVP